MYKPIVFMHRDAYVLWMAFCSSAELSSVNMFRMTFLLIAYLVISKFHRLVN